MKITFQNQTELLITPSEHELESLGFIQVYDSQGFILSDASIQINEGTKEARIFLTAANSGFVVLIPVESTTIKEYKEKPLPHATVPESATVLSILSAQIKTEQERQTKETQGIHALLEEQGIKPAFVPLEFDASGTAILPEKPKTIKKELEELNTLLKQKEEELNQFKTLFQKGEQELSNIKKELGKKEERLARSEKIISVIEASSTFADLKKKLKIVISPV